MDSPEQNGTVEVSGEEALVVYIAGGKSISAAAELAGIGRTTAHRFMKDPAFRAKVDAVRREWLDRAVGHLAESAAEAVIWLRRQLQSGDGECEHCGRGANTAALVGAAKALLDRATPAQCEDCRKRAEADRTRPPIDLQRLLEEDARIKSELAEAQRLVSEPKDLPNILCYEEGV